MPGWEENFLYTSFSFHEFYRYEWENLEIMWIGITFPTIWIHFAGYFHIFKIFHKEKVHFLYKLYSCLIGWLMIKNFIQIRGLHTEEGNVGRYEFFIFTI